MLRVGVITSPHGIKGEVKVFPTTDDAKRFKELKEVILDTGKEHIPMEIEHVKFFKNMVILKFKGYDNINEIEKYKSRDLLADHTSAEDREESRFIWNNFYDEEDKVNEYDLTLFVKEGELYRKFEETHYQRAYGLDQIQQAIRDGGMEFVAAYDACTRNPVQQDSERIYVIARENGK